jgi:hypothetical protein
MKKLLILSTICILFLSMTIGFAREGGGKGQGGQKSRNRRESEESVESEEIKGKDIASKGFLTDLSGTLKYEGGEWYLVSDEGSFQIHLGPKSYLDSINFKLTEGDQAEIKGFVLEDHIAPCKITTAGKSIELRDENGRPAWAGSKFSQGKNK